jgi:SpoVK/Ycf46/Vps4 family AAA+-type ATPase
MSDNLDSAFERRFLFKIQFGKPTIEAKQQIWMDKLPTLPLESAQNFAMEYDFSGGEIDNIVRKAMMREVIAGEQPTLSVLQEYCKEEKLTKKGGLSRIGFR